jgi:hypothetical protein
MPRSREVDSTAMLVDGFEDLPPCVAPRAAKRVPCRVHVVIPNAFQNDPKVSERALFRIHQDVEQTQNNGIGPSAPNFSKSAFSGTESTTSKTSAG